MSSIRIYYFIVTLYSLNSATLGVCVCVCVDGPGRARGLRTLATVCGRRPLLVLVLRLLRLERLFGQGVKARHELDALLEAVQSLL